MHITQCFQLIVVPIRTHKSLHTHIQTQPRSKQFEELCFQMELLLAFVPYIPVLHCSFHFPIIKRVGSSDKPIPIGSCTFAECCIEVYIVFTQAEKMMIDICVIRKIRTVISHIKFKKGLFIRCVAKLGRTG